ncbi:hypothetical protein IWQ57_005041, partial [Coemansia nantahalensis]
PGAGHVADLARALPAAYAPVARAAPAGNAGPRTAESLAAAAAAGGAAAVGASGQAGGASAADVADPGRDGRRGVCVRRAREPVAAAGPADVRGGRAAVHRVPARHQRRVPASVGAGGAHGARRDARAAQAPGHGPHRGARVGQAAQRVHPLPQLEPGEDQAALPERQPDRPVAHRRRALAQRGPASQGALPAAVPRRARDLPRPPEDPEHGGRAQRPLPVPVGCPAPRLPPARVPCDTRAQAPAQQLCAPGCHKAKLCPEPPSL